MISSVMNINQKEGTRFLSFKKLDELSFIGHGFSTREGGASSGIYESMNLSFGRGDSDENVRDNFCIMGKAIGFNPEDVVMPVQTHTANVLKVDKTDKEGGFVRKEHLENVDGLVTNEPGLVLGGSYSDCAPIYLVDPVKKAIGLCHSGWRGTAAQIGMVTAEKMVSEFDSDPADIYAAIGPCICKSCYEVSGDLYEAFSEVFTEKELGSIFEKREDVPGKYQLDLPRACKITLMKAGLKEEHISVSDICTCCNGKLLWSHRYTKGKRGGGAGFLWIEKQSL